MRICFIPIDNRPVCYDLAKDITAIDNSIELLIPPHNMLGSLVKYADSESILNWIENLPDFDVMVLSLDTLAYGGLIPSRRICDSYEQIKSRIKRLKPIIKGKKVFAFSSIMRISNNNCNEEEKEYWNEFGTKIFEFSYKSHKLGKKIKTNIPQEIIDDYIQTRNRNFKINKLYLEWQKEGFFDTLIFSKDDCAEYGFNVQEAAEIEKLGGTTKTGADEIPLMLLAKALEKEIKIYPLFLEPDYKNCISNYEDVSIEKSVLGQLRLGGFKIAETEDESDVVLVINNFIEKQGELVMKWETEPFGRKFIRPSKPYAVADVRYANGSDNKLISELFKQETMPEYGYSGWNTSANSIGSLLSAVKVKYHAKEYNDTAFKKLQLIRLLDDWGYQANVRDKITKPCDIKDLMTPYENKVLDFLQENDKSYNISYSFPWNRKFEISISVN